MRYIADGGNNILRKSRYIVNRPETFKNRWSQEFGNDNPIHLELGMVK